VAAQQQLWAAIEQEFDGLLFDKRNSSLNVTTVAQLVHANQRAVVYTSPGNLSFDSPYALDGCTIDNQRVGGVTNMTYTSYHTERLLRNASAHRAADKARNSLFLLTMAGEGEKNYLLYAFLLTYLPLNASGLVADCAARFGIPQLTWCPLTLMDVCLLTNYYRQLAFEAAVTTPGFDLPGAVYMDALDVDGTIRTGTALFGPMFPHANQSGPHAVDRYAYSATMLFGTVARLCQNPDFAWVGADPAACKALLASLYSQRSLYPATRWEDPSTGRHIDWPPQSAVDTGSWRVK
jgi:hypothetical protein